ncbi:uncharacterized protein LOC132046561 isoform X10 [Lycium ferocissimum]|uniref:uncharacterized protein LOC132046561 isoform X10 n=1 Tax=Lycium ferocissimum TaxID=112874 RepID=UPI0028149F23|nr:uncharacterized protein LOC132046561 isoform X10 [Lycium ferocissimum]
MAPKNLTFKIILGSSSMARRKILVDMGYEFTLMTADIDEKSIRKDNAEELVVALAEAKVAVYQGIIREKPSSYSGGQATVVGSVVVTNLTKGIRKGAWERSEVYFHDIPDEVIDSLIEEGIILNVAGGLMLEHPLTLPFVDTVIGTADSVMGLPRSLTEKLIQEAL